MKVFPVIGSYGHGLREVLARPFMLYRLIMKYPTCRFPLRVCSDNSMVIGDYDERNI